MHRNSCKVYRSGNRFYVDAHNPIIVLAGKPGKLKQCVETVKIKHYTTFVVPPKTDDFVVLVCTNNTFVQTDVLNSIVKPHSNNYIMPKPLLDTEFSYKLVDSFVHLPFRAFAAHGALVSTLKTKCVNGVFVTSFNFVSLDCCNCLSSNCNCSDDENNGKSNNNDYNDDENNGKNNGKSNENNGNNNKLNNNTYNKPNKSIIKTVKLYNTENTNEFIVLKNVPVHQCLIQIQFVHLRSGVQLKFKGTAQITLLDEQLVKIGECVVENEYLLYPCCSSYILLEIGKDSLLLSVDALFRKKVEKVVDVEVCNGTLRVNNNYGDNTTNENNLIYKTLLKSNDNINFFSTSECLELNNGSYVLKKDSFYYKLVFEDDEYYYVTKSFNYSYMCDVKNEVMYGYCGVNCDIVCSECVIGVLSGNYCCCRNSGCFYYCSCNCCKCDCECSSKFDCDCECSCKKNIKGNENNGNDNKGDDNGKNNNGNDIKGEENNGKNTDTKTTDTNTKDTTKTTDTNKTNCTHQTQQQIQQLHKDFNIKYTFTNGWLTVTSPHLLNAYDFKLKSKHYTLDTLWYINGNSAYCRVQNYGGAHLCEFSVVVFFRGVQLGEFGVDCVETRECGVIDFNNWVDLMIKNVDVYLFNGKYYEFLKRVGNLNELNGLKLSNKKTYKLRCVVGGRVFWSGEFVWVDVVESGDWDLVVAVFGFVGLVVLVWWGW